MFGYVGTSDYLGIELIDGKGGTDTVDFSRFSSAVWVDLNYGPIEAYTQDDGTAYDAGLYRKIADLTSIENVTGTNYSDYIKGTHGANVIDAQDGADVIAGRGGADTFIFTTADAAGFSGNTIEDFEADDGEKIDLSGVDEILNFNDLMNNHLSDVGGTATIDDGAGLTIALDGWTAANFGAGNPISADDFIF